MKSWTKRKARGEFYIRVDAFRVTVGDHDGSGHSDFGSTCSYSDFLGGRLHDVIVADHSARVLKQVIAAVQGAADNPDFQRAYARLDRALAAWREIPENPALSQLAKAPDDDGMRHYDGKSPNAVAHGGLLYAVHRQSIRVTDARDQAIFAVPARDNPLSLSNAIAIQRVIRVGDMVLYRADNLTYRDVPAALALVGERSWLHVTSAGIVGRCRSDT